MKLLALIFIGLGVLFIILYVLFAGPTYEVYQQSVWHTSMPVAASFVIGAGIALLLADYNIRKEPRRPTDPRDPRRDERIL